MTTADIDAVIAAIAALPKIWRARLELDCTPQELAQVCPDGRWTTYVCDEVPHLNLRTRSIDSYVVVAGACEITPARLKHREPTEGELAQLASEPATLNRGTTIRHDRAP